MAADMHVFTDNGGAAAAPGSSNDLESNTPVNLRYKRADTCFTIDTANPNTIPVLVSDDDTLSYWVSSYLEALTAPASQIDNVQFYTLGTGNPTGVDVIVGDQLPTKNSASNAGYIPATAADTEIVSNYTGITSSQSAYNYTSSSTLAISISESGSIIDASGESTDYLISQMQVAFGAGPGQITAQTFTYQYDEI